MEYEDKLVIRIITAIVIAALGACAFLVITVFGSIDANKNTMPNTIDKFTVQNAEGELMYEYINKGRIDIEYDAKNAEIIVTVPKVGNDTPLAEKYKELDKTSYHYDADNIFLYIDMQENIGALYYGTVPLGHFELETNTIRFDERVFNTPTLIENYQANWWRED